MLDRILLEGFQTVECITVFFFSMRKEKWSLGGLLAGLFCLNFVVRLNLLFLL